jgi:hypothetical protein
MMFACFQLLGRIRANLMMHRVGSRKGVEAFTMDPARPRPFRAS